MLVISSEVSTSILTTEYLFSGIGGTIICSVITLIIGGLVGYRIGVKNRVKQSQKAGNHATQNQKVTVGTSISKDKAQHVSNAINQKQTAGDNAHQSQIGGVYNGE